MPTRSSRLCSTICARCAASPLRRNDWYAAEVLTGALKENKRARVVGQTTYGKGCSQGLWTLPTEGELRSPPALKIGLPTGGIRLTVARFFSPTGQPYSGRGVEPDIFTEGESEQLATAQRLLAMIP